MSKALILIDLQNDFCPGGTLAVRDGDQTLSIANQYARAFYQRGEPVIATQDWHPANHGSFASVSGFPPFSEGELNGLPQIWWPDHAIENTSGAELHPELDQSYITTYIRKGLDATIDSYSAFFDNGHRRETELDEWLRVRYITQLVIMGLATDFCVKHSVLDALSLGYQVEVVQKGCRAVNMHPGDDEKTFIELATAGAIII